MYISTTPSNITSLSITDLMVKSNILTANAALLDKHGMELGTFNMLGIWSGRTKKALNELITSIEEDMALSQFGESGIKATINPEDNYEEASIHEHVEIFTPNNLEDSYDIEKEF